MAKHGKKPHFFRVILPQIIQCGTLELPRSFVKEHGKRLPMYARLKLPTGSESKMELKRNKVRIWLDKGWSDFVQKYSIKCGYFLVFKYGGGSHFSVRIYDLSTSEIDYPVSSATTTKTMAMECQVTKVKVEDSLDDDDYECLLEVQKCGEMESATHKIGVIKGRRLGATCARERVLERAKGFESRNPHFIVIMQPSYVSGHYFLNIPEVPARSYFHKKENNIIDLEGEDGRIWSAKYYIGGPPRHRVRIDSGWKHFSQENHLQEGDVCLFELVSRRALAFKVAIFRNSDEQVDKNEPSEIAPLRGTRTEKTRVLKREACHVASNTLDRVLKRPGSFMIYMSQFYISRWAAVHIPIAHFRRYLRGDKHGENIIILHGSNGKTWPVKYCVHTNSSKGGSITHGWEDFASDNYLRVGDICVFEMIFGKAKTYKVTISRVADRA